MTVPAAPTWWRPARHRGAELLDDPDVDPALADRSLRDIALANRLFGGTRAVRAALVPLWPRLGRQATLLDVGTGRGDIPRAVSREAARRGVTLHTIGLEPSAPLAALARGGPRHLLAADGRRLPFADGAVDVITLAQVVHHFSDEEAVALLAECRRVARVAVIVSDLRRSRVAAGLLWSASWPLAFHAVSRHDGVLSVLRGFTADELRLLGRRAFGREPVVVRRPGWRLTATWTAG